tara:strand:+ start:1419 stop:3161 length:1743 start_codon:yes stop_codon:yes gene_type:complete
MKKIKIGQIGRGSFGNKILSKLENISDVSIEWVYGSKDKWWECDKELNWVIIASPNEFHYEQAKHFLKRGVNVFCEKPATLSTHSLLELISLSELNNTFFYVDDVLTYENIEPINSFIYKKWGGLSANIIDRMAYHHFYLIYDMVKSNGVPDEINIITNDLSHKIFEIIIDDLDFKFEYDFGWYEQKVHNITSRFDGDALETMLTKVLHQEVDFELNHKRSIFATRLSQHVKNKLYGKCAVVGGGIYGVTMATKLKVSGYDVDLYEQDHQIMNRASGINQYRLHRGYHYPRSVDTIESCKSNENSFIKYYNESIVNGDIKHYYSIASEDSLITAQQYLTTLDNSKLNWKIVESLPNCDLTIEVDEKLYDPNILRSICIHRLYGNGVNVNLNKKYNGQGNYKNIIYSTYSSLNDFTKEKQNYQFELCEKPLFKLPKIYKGKSIVIMDGPFMCFDPYSDTEYHLAGNVVHAIHVRHIGKKPEIPTVYKEYLNKGIIKNPKYTNVNRFVESAKKFFPEIESAEHIGSMYTIRTVLPHKDKTDERPTIVTKQNNDYILFSSKVGNCVDAARKVINMINEKNRSV